MAALHRVPIRWLLPLVVLATVVVPATGAPPAAAVGDCDAAADEADDLGLELWVWEGDDLTEPTRWDLAENWTQPDGKAGETPGVFEDPDALDDLACIPAGEQVELVEWFTGIALLRNAGRLEIPLGTRFSLTGHPDDMQSSSHQMVLEGVLMGRGELAVTAGGWLKWQSTPSGVSAMTTRYPASSDPEEYEEQQRALEAREGLPPVPGRTVIESGADLTIRAVPGVPGFNLYDGRVIVNRGRTRVMGISYVAANHGTQFRNRGSFVFRGDGDYVEGWRPEPGDPPMPPTRFVNTGVVRKASGTELSAIDGDYRQTDGTDTGRVELLSGRLSIARQSGEVSAVQLRPSPTRAVTIGTGGCEAQATCDETTLNDTAPVVSLTRPQNTTATAARIELLPPASDVAAIRLRVPQPTPLANPMRFLIELHDDLLDGKTAGQLQVWHDGVRVRSCGSTAPPCVSQKTPIPDGAKVVVRTHRNGRWRIR